MKKNGFAPILILILIALAAVGYFGYKNYRPRPQTVVVTSPVPTVTVDPTVNWKIFSQDKFSVKLPSTWISKHTTDSVGTNWIFMSGAPGREELIVSKLDINSDKLKSDVISTLSANPPFTAKTVTLGAATGTEYFGCFGEDGCMNQYIIVTSFNGSTFEISFTPYPDQEANLYQNIISTFKFIK